MKNQKLTDLEIAIKIEEIEREETMKQTAVQWFAARIMTLNISPKEMHDFLEWFEEAKQMEKQQIKNAYQVVDLDIQHSEDFNEINSEEYYKDTYGKDA